MKWTACSRVYMRSTILNDNQQLIAHHPTVLVLLPKYLPLL